MTIPAARAALEKEWTKLESKHAWDLRNPREYYEIRDEATRQGRTVHFGRVHPLMHIKHSELPEHLQTYKGRIVFTGNRVQDETGYSAVFSEQGTSASHLTAAKFLDAIARMPGNSGQDSDAMGAYTQAKFVGVEAWVEIPKDRWPKHWHNKYKRPVCRLQLNLYGHPLAGLYWEQHCHKAITKCGFTRVKGWECLYKHHEQQLFLSVYVDDFKMCGKERNLAPMWTKLGKYLDLEPPTPLHGNVYLGCGQSNVTPFPEHSRRKGTTLPNHVHQKPNQHDPI